MTTTRPGWNILVTAALYSAGAHGIMTLNDFKSVEGDRRLGVFSLPVLLGVEASQARTTYIDNGFRLNNHYDLALAYLF